MHIRGTDTVRKGLQIGGSESNVLIGYSVIAPYSAGCLYTDAELNSLGINSQIYYNGGGLIKKRDTANSLDDWDEVGSGGSSSFLLKAADFIVDQAGDSAAQTTWAGTSPVATETFLDSEAGIIYQGNGTGTPDIFQTAAQLDGLRIAIRNSAVIYLGNIAGNLVADPRDGAADVGKWIFVKSEEAEGTGAIYKWNSTNWEEDSDPDWAYFDGLSLRPGYTSPAATGIHQDVLETDNGQQIIQKLESNIKNLCQTATVNIGDGNKTQVISRLIPPGGATYRNKVKVTNFTTGLRTSAEINVEVGRDMSDHSAIDDSGLKTEMRVEPTADPINLIVEPELDASHNYTLSVTIGNYSSGTYRVEVTESSV